MRKWRSVVTATKQVPWKQKQYKGPVKILITAFFERPLHHLLRHKKGLRATAPDTYHQKPDSDNIAKFVCDCLSGIAFHDDCQINHLQVSKEWVTDLRKGARTEVELWYKI